MVIGNGMLARAFQPQFGVDPGVVIFASGVSASNETRRECFLREAALLEPLLASSDAELVYFSSCALLASSGADTPYLAHKRAMEERVLDCGHGRVFRLPQAVGNGGNPATLTNFLYQKILAGEHFTLWAKAERNLIDVEHIVLIATTLIRGSHATDGPINIASPKSLPMPAIVEIFEGILGRKANCTWLDIGSPMQIPMDTAGQAALELGIELGEGYAKATIEKYYG